MLLFGILLLTPVADLPPTAAVVGINDISGQ
jgi:hypothetical protein